VTLGRLRTNAARVGLCCVLALACLVASTARPAEPADAGATPTALLLPVNFRVYESSIGNAEPIPDLTQLVRRYLAEGIGKILPVRAGLAVRPLPELTTEEKAIVQEHLLLATRIVAQAADYANAPWRPRRARLDLSFGDGLAFLRERTGARYALVVDGFEFKQSVGAAIMGSTFGGGSIPDQTWVRLVLLDLEHGRLAWFNDAKIPPRMYGGGAVHMLDDRVMRKTLQSALEPYPKIPVLSD
jgi:hypothetical protein